MTSLWTQYPVSGHGFGMKSARTPELRAAHDCPSSVVSNVPTAEIATHIRSASVGWGTIVCRISPPAPGCQVGRLGWFVRPSTWAHVWAPSSLRNSPAGPTPAKTEPLAGVTFHTALIFGPSSPYVRPELDWVHVLPRSSLRKTVGPYQGLPPPA